MGVRPWVEVIPLGFLAPLQETRRVNTQTFNSFHTNTQSKRRRVHTWWLNAVCPQRWSDRWSAAPLWLSTPWRPLPPRCILGNVGKVTFSIQIKTVFLLDLRTTTCLTFVRTLGDTDRLTNQLVVSPSSAPPHPPSPSPSSSLLLTCRITTTQCLMNLL